MSCSPAAPRSSSDLQHKDLKKTPRSLVLQHRRGYSKLNTIVNQHKVVVLTDKTQVDKVFPWVHKTISNAKRLLLGIHHSIKSSYMQNYLDEYCYKFSRRYLGDKIFDRLLIAAVACPCYSNVYQNG